MADEKREMWLNWLAITLSAIAALLKKRPLWYFGRACGVVGLVYFANGHWLFFGHPKAPPTPAKQAYNLLLHMQQKAAAGS